MLGGLRPVHNLVELPLRASATDSDAWISHDHFREIVRRRKYSCRLTTFWVPDPKRGAANPESLRLYGPESPGNSCGSGHRS